MIEGMVIDMNDKQMMTPYEKLKSLPDADQFLKPGVTFEFLDREAHALSENEAAKRLTKPAKLSSKRLTPEKGRLIQNS